jgi:D-alanyl-D-alanine dipeptidase
MLLLAAGPFMLSATAEAQTCPALLTGARRLLLVTAPAMSSTAATLRLFERDAAAQPWRAVGEPEPAVIGRTGMGWSQFFRHLARPGEPIKVERDKRTPAGIYSVGRSFGTLPLSRPGHIHVTPETVCVDDPSSPAYNRIASRRQVDPNVHVENMSRMLPMYRRGLVVNYPTDARRMAGSCIFIHVWKSPTTGTAGCVAVPEARMEALQEFADGNTAIAILPTAALDRLRGCLPTVARN